MLQKKQRLSAAEVRKVLKLGRSARVRAVSARYGTGESSKAAVVVSAKVARKAAERNRLRRAGYRALSSLPQKTHLVIFIHAKEFNPKDVELLCSKLS